MTDDVLAAVRQALPGLRPAELRIAKVVLADPVSATDGTMVELAQAADTSQATVARFCSAVGYTGYPEFRIALARTISREQVQLTRFGVADSEIDPSDSAADVVAKMAYNEARTIEETAAAIDTAVLDQIVSALVAAPRIDIYGVASSALTGLDLQQKLHRVGLISHSWADAHLALTSAAVLGEGAVAIGISHSGRTVETVRALEVAARAGATTVALTNYPESPLGRLADLSLCTVTRETLYRSGAMSSRIAQLAVVDFLFVRLAQQLYETVADSLESTYRAVQPQRLTWDGNTSRE